MVSTTFQNPVIRGFNPDPTVAVVKTPGSTTYFLSTSTFELYPGCAIYSSTDLINWTLIGHALTRRSQIDLRTVEPGAGSWASTLRYRPNDGRDGKGRFYLANGLFQRYRPSADVSMMSGRDDRVHTFEKKGKNSQKAVAELSIVKSIGARIPTWILRLHR